MAYYLEDLERVHDLSLEKLGEWKEKYPYSQLVHFLMAKKHQVEGFLDDMSVFHKASFYAVDRVFLQSRMSAVEEIPYDKTSTSPEIGEIADLNKDELQSENAVDTGEAKAVHGTEKKDVEEDDTQNEDLGTHTVVAKLQEQVEESSTGIEQTQAESETTPSEVHEKVLNENLDEDLSPFAKWVNGFDMDEIDIKKKKKKKSKKSKLKKQIAESIIKDDEIVSEPLAMILAQQGHIEKSKAMYEKLSLIFPEKSSFFALQIEKLINSK